MKNILTSLGFLMFFAGSVSLAQNSDTETLQYKLLATTRTSTMQKEINEAAAQGYRIIVGAPTSGSEMVLFLSLDGTVAAPFQYKILATTRTGTMQKEMSEVADEGYRLIPSTMMAKKQLFGGVEIVMVFERQPKPAKRYEYKLLATSRTSTMQKEVTGAKNSGYVIVGMISRDEHMVVMEREASNLP